MSKTFKADNSVFFQTIEIIRLELQEHFWISCLRRVFRQSKYTSKNFSPYFHPNQTCGAKTQHSLDELDKIKPVEKLSRYLFLCLPAPPNGKNFAKSSLTFIKAFSHGFTSVKKRPSNRTDTCAQFLRQLQTYFWCLGFSF